MHPAIIVEKLIKIQSQIEADNFTRENIDYLIKDIQAGEERKEQKLARKLLERSEVENRILDLIDNRDEMTRSDLQGAVGALVMQLV